MVFVFIERFSGNMESNGVVWLFLIVLENLGRGNDEFRVFNF